MKVIQITDTHFVAPGQRLYELDPRARLEACVDDINRHHGDADLCVITGDLAHQGDLKAYASLRECLNALQIPLRLLIGNHDHRARFLQIFPEMPVATDGFVQSYWDSPEGRLLFLDTTREGRHTGYYCSTRRQWLRQALHEADGLPVYVFMHHPPFDIGLPSCDVLGIENVGDIQTDLKACQNLRHIFFGHIHRPISGSWRGVPFTALRATAHQTLLDFEAKQETHFSHEPPAYAVALMEADQCTVHFHDYLDASPRVKVGVAPPFLRSLFQ